MPVVDHRPVALTDIRVGGSPGEARLHATLAEGRHAGVEIRAVERNGRVTIELLAPTEMAERALRAEIHQVREILAARGLDTVAVEVHTGEQERRHHPSTTEETQQETPPSMHAPQKTNPPFNESDEDMVW